MAKTNVLQIDPVKKQPTARQTHPVLITMFALVVMCILACAVWFFGFSEWGFEWSGNEAKMMTLTPKEVVVNYPSVHLTSNDVALILDVGKQVRLRADVHKTKSSQHVNPKDLILRWHSENPNVARVNHKGVVTAIGEGTARITVTVGNSDIDSNTVCCLVTVRTPKAAPDETASERARKR